MAHGFAQRGRDVTQWNPHKERDRVGGNKGSQGSCGIASGAGCSANLHLLLCPATSSRDSSNGPALAHVLDDRITHLVAGRACNSGRCVVGFPKLVPSLVAGRARNPGRCGVGFRLFESLTVLLGAFYCQ